MLKLAVLLFAATAVAYEFPEDTCDADKAELKLCQDCASLYFGDSLDTSIMREDRDRLAMPSNLYFGVGAESSEVCATPGTCLVLDTFAGADGNVLLGSGDATCIEVTDDDDATIAAFGKSVQLKDEETIDCSTATDGHIFFENGGASDDKLWICIDGTKVPFCIKTE